jgi:biopolymer transport protein ExbB
MKSKFSPPRRSLLILLCSTAITLSLFADVVQAQDDSASSGSLMSSDLVVWLGNSIYGLQFFDAVWGSFCIIVVWRRLKQIRFKSEDQQNEFLDQVLDLVQAGEFDAAAQMCEDDPRIVPQLMYLALSNRDLGFSKVKQLVADRFQRDVLSEMEYRITWVVTMIKSAPMLGLLGTVLGMMSAFGKLAGQQKVDASNLAGDISIALITTFVGLSIAIPLSLVLASVQIRTRKMEDLVGDGMARFMEVFKPALDQQPAETVRS